MTAGLPIDFDHAIDLGAPQGQPAPAAGWIKELRQVNGVIQGRVEWTAAGAKALAAKLYRYISPVFEFSDDGTVQRLLRAAVTNNPNLYLKAIASVESGTGPAVAESCRRAVNQIRQALGAPSDAKLQAAQDSLTRATIQAASRSLSADDLELCGRQGVDVARFALAKRDRMTGTPLVMATPIAKHGAEVTNPQRLSRSLASCLKKALEEIDAFLGNQQDKDGLQHLLNASACVGRATKERDQRGARFSQASRLS
jgi:phage I-like protein